VSFAKIMCGSEINRLRKILSVAFCYECEPCLAFYAFGLVPSFGCFVLARPC
jgi:hypothetical protein